MRGDREAVRQRYGWPDIAQKLLDAGATISGRDLCDYAGLPSDYRKTAPWNALDALFKRDSTIEVVYSKPTLYYRRKRES